jgi:hypothetical protein
MHVLTADELSALAGAELLVEAAMTRGQTMFLRALKKDPPAPCVQKRDM